MSREFYNDAVLRTTDDAQANSQLNGGQIILAQASNCGWRACYGVDPNIGRQLDQRNQQLRSDVENARPTGQWHPDPSKLRNWNDPLDDPDGSGARALGNMRNNGIAPQVFQQGNGRGQNNGNDQSQSGNYASPNLPRPGTAPMFQVPGRNQQPPYEGNNPYVANNPYLSGIGNGGYAPFAPADVAPPDANSAGVYLGAVGNRPFVQLTPAYQGIGAEIQTGASTATTAYPFQGAGGYRPFAPQDAPTVPALSRPIWLPPGG